MNEKSLGELIGNAVGGAFARRKQRGKRFRLGFAQFFQIRKIEAAQRLEQRTRIVQRLEAEPCFDQVELASERRELESNRMRIQLVEQQ